MADEPNEGFLRVFRHHQTRRLRGVPTVSLLIADGPALPHACEAALERSGLDVLYSSAVERQAILRDWLVSIETEHDLEATAFAQLARGLRTSEAELRASWSTRALGERQRWLEQRRRESPQLSAALNVLRAACMPVNDAWDDVARLRDVLALTPNGDKVVLCVESADAARLRGLLGLVSDMPAWPILAVVERSAWPEVRAELDDRSRTLLEDGHLPEPPPSVPPRPPTRPPSAAAKSGAGPSDLPDVRAEASEAVARARVATHSHAPNADACEDRARSLAELRLYQLLQAEPVTRNLFQLNGELPFTFGVRRAEVDLVCVELRLAVEVDGYHHFREFDGYRRDRRKDVLLQHQGYIVSRHLAGDVVERPGEVVRAIRQLVLRRRRSLRRENLG